MTQLLELPDLRDGYVTLVDRVVHDGHEVSPRGQAVFEVTDFTFTVGDLTNTLPVGVGRDVDTVIAALEAAQLIGEVSVPELLTSAAPQFVNYQEPDGTFYGAYGRRVAGQAAAVLDKIERDRDTRQAVITLWDPRLDNESGHRDYPCTLALGFRVRRDRLDASVVMRSNDVWLGTAYDVFQFTQLQWTLARELGVEPGTYTHTAWSLHIYERDLPRVAKLHPATTDPVRLPRGLPSPASTSVDLLACDLLRDPSRASSDPDVEWYRERLATAHERR